MEILGFFLLVAVLLALRQSVILIVAVGTIYIHLFFANSKILFFIQDIWIAVNREVLLTIPMFMLAGAVMTRGEIAKRLIRIIVALTASFRGGLGLAAVASCAMFASISGSSVVTMLAVGTILYPALLQSGYQKNFALGSLASAGTLGMIIPPSIAMIIYGIITETSIVDLFIAGVLPGLVLAGLLGGYSLWVNRGLEPVAFDPGELWTALKEGVFSLMLPVILLGGIYSGFFTATEAAAVTLFYAVAIEFLVHREMTVRDLIDIVIETTLLLGMLLPLIAIASSLNTILQFENIPQDIAAYISTTIHNRWLVIISINLLLLLVGCFMDSISALIILSGILLPIVQAHGFDPVHFGIIMVVNLEIGFLTPPVGLNIMVATIAFKEKFGTVIAAVIPFLFVMLAGLAIITAVPWLSTALIR